MPLPVHSKSYENDSEENNQTIFPTVSATLRPVSRSASLRVNISWRATFSYFIDDNIVERRGVRIDRHAPKESKAAGIGYEKFRLSFFGRKVDRRSG